MTWLLTFIAALIAHCVFGFVILRLIDSMPGYTTRESVRIIFQISIVGAFFTALPIPYYIPVIIGLISTTIVHGLERPASIAYVLLFLPMFYGTLFLFSLI